MNPQQITDYIKQHLDQGISEEDIRNHLLANGWSDVTVAQAFDTYHHEQSVPSPIVPQSGSGSSQTPKPKRQKATLVKRVAIIVAIVVVGLIALFHFLVTSPAVPKTLDKLATPALERNADNTSRENDVSMIASALATYISGHQSTFPQSTATDTSPKTLDICGADCTPANRVTVPLGYYANTPAAVSFHDYASNLTVPNTQTVYIVPNANCKSDNSGIGLSTTGKQYISIAVLYAIQSGVGTTQQCLSPY